MQLDNLLQDNRFCLRPLAVQATNKANKTISKALTNQDQPTK